MLLGSCQTTFSGMGHGAGGEGIDKQTLADMRVQRHISPLRSPVDPERAVVYSLYTLRASGIGFPATTSDRPPEHSERDPINDSNQGTIACNHNNTYIEQQIQPRQRRGKETDNVHI